jgi:transcriptional regulator with XRE-family HTH domain
MDAVVPATFDALLRTRRKALNLSQAALAGKIGVSRTTISRWERGKLAEHDPHVRVLCKLADELHVEQVSFLALACAALK